MNYAWLTHVFACLFGVVIGGSFGAAVAWRIASEKAHQCGSIRHYVDKAAEVANNRERLLQDRHPGWPHDRDAYGSDRRQP